ncbi:MAG: GntR family transcriptional regulator [Burkholderiaceae bacterium]
MLPTSPLHADLARQFVQWAVAQRLPAGTHLTEQAVAQRLAVSRTPVRAMLDALVQQQLVERRPRRGYFLAADGETLEQHLRTLPDDRVEALCNRLLMDRVTGRLPLRCSERELRTLYPGSRTQLEQALFKLVRDGLLRRRRGLGWEFADAHDSPQAELESYRFRMLVECNALLAPGYALSAERLGALRARHHALLQASRQPRWTDFWDVNAEFHETLAAGAGNRFILSTIREQNRLRRLTDLADYPSLPRERRAHTAYEHLAILDAIEAGDMPRAAELMRAHLQSASDIVAARATG